MPRYIALCAHGLEKFVVGELGDVSNVQIFKGIVLFDFEDNIEELLEIKVVDDILFLVKKLAGISRYVSSLRNIRHQIAKCNFRGESFSVKASYKGKRDYTAKDIVRVVEKEVAKKYKIGGDVIHVILREDISLVGVECSPLHIKPNLRQLPGSLKISVAYALLKFADVKEGDVVLDPMCGAGTIPICAFGAKCIGGDIDRDKIDAAIENNKVMNTAVEFHVWDARNTFLADNCVDKIVCNLPFGKQVKLPGGFLKKFIDEMIRVSKKGSRWVLLTAHGDIIKKMIGKHRIRIRDCIKIVNSGMECEILVLDI